MAMLMRWRDRWAARREDDRGASVVEYALMVALIAMVCIAAVTFVGTSSSSQYSRYNECVSWAGTGTPIPANCQR